MIKQNLVFVHIENDSEMTEPENNDYAINDNDINEDDIYIYIFNLIEGFKRNGTSKEIHNNITKKIRYDNTE